MDDNHMVGSINQQIDASDYCVWQYEIAPTTGKVHIQGYVVFTGRKRLGSVKKIIKDWCGVNAHLEVARGTPTQNRTYCTKDETRYPGTEPVEFGHLDQEGQGKRTDLVEAWNEFKANGLTDEMVERFPSQLVLHLRRFTELKERLETRNWEPQQGYQKKTVIVNWGETGTGKTREAAESGAIFAKYESRYCWGHYRGEETVCFDEFMGQVTIEEMLTLCDGYRATVQIPYMGNKPWIPKTIFICSNNSVNDWWPKATSEQIAAFKRRITRMVHWRNTPLGVCKSYQIGVDPASVMDVDQGLYLPDFA